MNIRIYLAILLTIILPSCSSSRKSVKATQASEVKLNRGQFEKDSSLIEYFIDTTSRHETEVVFNRIEYYPIVLSDTLKGSITARQAVKSAQTISVRKHAEKQGKTEVKEERQVTTHDSIKAEVKQCSTTVTRTSTSCSKIRYIIPFLVLLMFVAYFWLRRRNR